MTTQNPFLPTRFLLHADVGKAAEEAHVALNRLIQAGFHEAAFELAWRLATSAAWRTRRMEHLDYALAQVLLWLCARLKRDFPGVGEEAARSAGECAEWLRSMQRVSEHPYAAFSKLTGASSPVPAGYLHSLLATVKPDAFGHLMNHFRSDIEADLKTRIHALAPNDGFGVRGHVSARFAPLSHGDIGDAVEQAARIAFPKDVATFSIDVALSVAYLDLLHGHTQLAIERLSRLLPGAKSEADRLARLSTMFADFLASRALAPAFRLNDAQVQAYLQMVATRSPLTLTPPAKPRPWKSVLKDYVERIKDEGVDKSTLVETVEYGSPSSKTLFARAKKQQLLNTAASPEDISAQEARLGTPLPPSYREFLLQANGMIVTGFVAVLPVGEIDWLKRIDADTVAAWNCDDEEASDEDYNTYGAAQDCIHMRPRHLEQALQISSNCDGDVLLLIPTVRFGEEWEAWFLGAKNPGAFRFRSFRDLMEQQVLVDNDE